MIPYRCGAAFFHPFNSIHSIHSIDSSSSLLIIVMPLSPPLDACYTLYAPGYYLAVGPEVSAGGFRLTQCIALSSRSILDLVQTDNQDNFPPIFVEFIQPFLTEATKLPFQFRMVKFQPTSHASWVCVAVLGPFVHSVLPASLTDTLGRIPKEWRQCCIVFPREELTTTDKKDM